MTERTSEAAILKTAKRDNAMDPFAEADIIREASRRREEVSAPSTPDTSADEEAWPAGTGWQGVGDPLHYQTEPGGSVHSGTEAVCVLLASAPQRDADCQEGSPGRSAGSCESNWKNAMCRRCLARPLPRL